MLEDEVSILETGHSDFPAALCREDGSGNYARVWAIGDVQILTKRLLGFFCSGKCPGDAILRTYDLARGLRDAGVPVIGGFHSSMEKECLDLLLRGQQPLVICPARGIERMRLPLPWRQALADRRLLVVSPFESRYRRPTTALAERRNRFVAALATEIFVAHAEPASKTEQLCRGLVDSGKRVWLLDGSPNPDLCERGATPISVEGLVSHASLTFQWIRVEP